MTRREWVAGQARSGLHWIALSGIFLLLLSGLLDLVHGWVYYVLFGLFFLVTSWPFLKMMIVITVLLSVLAAFFPVLAPFMLLLMAVFFVLRIRFVARHWRPLLMGVLVYGIGLSIGKWGWVVYLASDPFERPVMASVLLSAVMTALFHIGLCWLYRRGYSAESALGLMGSVPLFVIAFLLPFLKMAGAEGGFGEPAVFHDGAPGEAVHAGGAEPAAPQGMPDAIGKLHYVEPHVRMTADGPVSVEGHFQTNPDGLLTNNLGENGYHLGDSRGMAGAEGSIRTLPADPLRAAAGEVMEHVYPGDVEKEQEKKEKD